MSSTTQIETSNSSSQLILVIESSCDETAAAVVDRGLNVISSVVASQDELHQRFGGVVPEIASRAHLSRILPVIDEAMRRAEKSFDDLTAIAVMTEPGLVGSLLVGVTAAKTLAMVLNKPLIAVNHIHAHLYACRMVAQKNVFPAIGLVVSGGHTNLYECRTAIDYELLGSTIDDAAGEAFDKAAAMLGLPYPGGPWMQKVAKKGDRKAFTFPRSFIHDDRLAFSFSGLKTALRYTALGQPGSSTPAPELTEQRISDLAASFQEAVVDVLVSKSRQALKQRGLKTLCIGGGVAANARLREQLAEASRRYKFEVIIAPMSLCTDNAAMGAIAWELLDAGRTSELDLDVTPGLVRHSR
ncbi:tRNA (adenosine(37)-N6)-threonylcarbamoyltransferase complex transferase subunit TsaD [Planctomicrobium sp. SH668]|uniref:tRNA (adenosine(37)-N6)-threonylcarbamoyltransferase complex transferase subunit TsaD n=1 Tax=Planctomicrobium sp. SH668 TaxID=3448126 RepID=UPI003F5B54A3